VEDSLILLVAELAAERLRWTCDPKTIAAKSTEELKPLDVMVGQPRAYQALLFEFQVREPGFNIFVAGPPATGKTVTDSADYYQQYQY
jgi:hypothetical protein